MPRLITPNIKRPPVKIIPPEKALSTKGAKVITTKELASLQKQPLKKRFEALGIKRGNRADPEMKEKLIKRLWEKEHKLPIFRTHSKQRKLIEALAHHLSGGESIKDAALSYGLQPSELSRYKAEFFRADNLLVQYLEENFYKASIRSLGIFHDKAEAMSAPQAAITAGIFAEKGIQLSKARKTDFIEDAIPLHLMQRMSDVLQKLSKRPEPKVIDVQSETKLLTDGKST